MAPPRPFDGRRWIGDRRSFRVHDLEHEIPACDIDGIVAAEKVMLFGPDSLPEARNRGYRACRHCRVTA